MYYICYNLNMDKGDNMENEIEIMTKPAKAFLPLEVEAKVKELQESDPDWTYKAYHDPKGTGYSLIKIYDEDGIFISYF